MLLLVAATLTLLLAVGLCRGFASTKWAAVVFALVLVVLAIPLLWTALDATDGCLDSGGRWNAPAEVCER